MSEPKRMCPVHKDNQLTYLGYSKMFNGSKKRMEFYCDLCKIGYTEEVIK